MSLPVLIVDDDAGVLFLHELMIRESGISESISTFNRAKKALEYLEKPKGKMSDPLIFLDINMPEMDGWKFLESLDHSNQFDRVSVVMVTSSVNLSDREKAAQYRHVVEFIEKPLNLETCSMLRNHPALKNFFNGLD